MVNKPKIGVLLGDATGIGAEIICKSLNDKDIFPLANWVIIDDERIFQQGQKIAATNMSYKTINSINSLDSEENALWLINLGNNDPENLEFGKVSEVAGKAMEESFRAVIDLVNKKELDGVIYGPLNKEAMQRAGVEYKDEIQYFTKLTGGEREISLLSSLGNLWAIRVTNHLPLKDVSSNITKESVVKTIKIAHQSLLDAGYHNPKIFVSALNPHAGEGGMTGREEVEVISPGIKEVQKWGIDAEGPYPSDTIFLRTKTVKVDCIVNMYHDQSQIGLKLLGFDQGVTIVHGLPVPVVTPAHGTAFGKAGKGTADANATKEAFKLVSQMALKNS